MYTTLFLKQDLDIVILYYIDARGDDGCSDGNYNNINNLNYIMMVIMDVIVIIIIVISSVIAVFFII